jgi:hypothetical protein
MTVLTRLKARPVSAGVAFEAKLPLSGGSVVASYLLGRS